MSDSEVFHQEQEPRQEADTSGSLAQRISTAQRLALMARDKDVRGAAYAFARTVVNGAIAAADFVPIAGEVVSWGADLWKVIARAVGLKRFDLTPDVSIKWAVGSEAAEFFTGLAVPTHLVEASLQLRAELPRIREGLRRAREIWEAEIIDYRQNPQIAEAMRELDVEPPELSEE